MNKKTIETHEELLSITTPELMRSFYNPQKDERFVVARVMVKDI